MDGLKIRPKTAKDKIDELRDGSIRNKVKHRVKDRGRTEKTIKHKRNVRLTKKV